MNQKRDMKLKPYIAVCLTLLVALMLAPFTSQARYLNPATGRFWTMDTYDGSQQDPLSLHKYLYCADDPVNMADPEGNDPWEVLGGDSIIRGIMAMFSAAPQAKREAQRALITGGAPASIAKRKKIDEVARKYNGSHLWDFAVNKDNFPRNSNKCNKFVYDVTKEAGAEAVVAVSGTSRPPLAAEYADKNTAIPNWRPLVPGENPQPGDIAAYKLSGGGVRFSGHCGFIVIGGNLSAHYDGVYGVAGQFENNPDTRYRRYTGN